MMSRTKHHLLMRIGADGDNDRGQVFGSVGDDLPVHLGHPPGCIDQALAVRGPRRCPPGPVGPPARSWRGPSSSTPVLRRRASWTSRPPAATRSWPSGLRCLLLPAAAAAFATRLLSAALRSRSSSRAWKTSAGLSRPAEPRTLRGRWSLVDEKRRSCPARRDAR